MSCLLKRLRLYGLVRTVEHACHYYLALLDKQVIASGLKLKDMVLIPQLTFALRTDSKYFARLERVTAIKTLVESGHQKHVLYIRA